MKNFDLKKYLAENKLLNEEETDEITAQEQIANALKIHFKTAYETGLEAQPEDGYSSFDKKYWKNNEADIINTLENTKVNIGENINENFYNKPNTFKDGFERSIEQLNNILNSNVREYTLDEKEAIFIYSREIKTIISKLEEINIRIENFDLKKYLAENKLLKEQSKSLQLTSKESEKFDGDILRNAWFSGFHKGGKVDTNTLSAGEIGKMFQEWKSKI